MKLKVQVKCLHIFVRAIGNTCKIINKKLAGRRCRVQATGNTCNGRRPVKAAVWRLVKS